MELLKVNDQLIRQSPRCIGGFFCIKKEVKSLSAEKIQGLADTRFVVLVILIALLNFVSVFHRILDFKTGQDLYPAPFLLVEPDLIDF